MLVSSYNCKHSCIVSDVDLTLLYLNSGGEGGHVSRDCEAPTKAKECYKCGQEGHIVRILFIHSFIYYILTNNLLSLVIALLLMPTVEEEEAEEEVGNAINADKSGISLVHANLVVEVEEGTMHLIAAVDRRRP